MANESVEAFKRSVREIPEAMKARVIPELWRQANRLADEMRSQVRVGGADDRHAGATRNSIRVIPGERDTRIYVVAGGPPTTVNGYDHVMAEEYGTQKMTAVPFFWPSYRRLKASMLAAIKNAMNLKRANWG